MAIRTTEAAVREVMDTNADTAQIDAFITDASLWIDEEFVGSGLSAGRLEIIERYLTCALIRLRDLGLTEAKFDDMVEKYQVDREVTDYLLRAASFDSTGAIRRAFLAVKETRAAFGRFAQSFVDETDEA